MNGEDLLWVMLILGFEDYLEFLKVYFMRYREVSYILFLFLSFCYVRLILYFYLFVYVLNNFVVVVGGNKILYVIIFILFF